MNVKKIVFENFDTDDYGFHRVSILITGKKPALMINETSKHNDGEGEQCETIQLTSAATVALYEELHKIYSSKP